ncbi:cytochrome c [Roseovarius arcticus]|uniref:cytochrome c n=1 Tax=Roseovarius arcticus TaxID=2547404 RepID=UPI00111094B5|nr:cytochrome c [Roseovarius arcticus]
MRCGLILAFLVGAPAFAETPGAALYLHGEGAEIAIGGGSVSLPATRFACAGCHGADGRGRAEGVTVFPPVRWSDLSASGPYDRMSFARALTEGVAPHGRVLAQSMPRFRLEPDVLASLVDHLTALDASDRAGVTATQIRVAASGNADLDRGFAAAIEIFNAGGGAFGRQIVATLDSAALDLVSFDQGQAPRVKAACLAAAIAAIRQDGYEAVRLAGPSGDDIAYRLRAAGLLVDPDSEAVLHAGEPDVTPAAPGLTHYGCIDQLGPFVAELVRGGNHVALAVPDRAALGWAAASHRSADAMRGFALGMLLGRAALTAGRKVTLAELVETASALPIVPEIVRLAP